MSIQTPFITSVDVTCPNSECEESFTEKIKINDLEYASSEERQMGSEIQYDFFSKVTCPFCNNTFEIEGEVWEYPEGALNQVEIK